MRIRLLFVGAVLGPALSAVAQNHPHGFTFNLMPGATTRGGLNTVAGEVLARFDFDDYRGLDDTIDGFQAIVQDQDVLSTPGQPFDVYFHLEDPANPDFPNFPAGSPPGTNALGGALAIPGPTALSPGATTEGAALISVAFVTPLQATIGSDLFVAFNLAAEPVWPADGLSVQISLGVNPNFPPPTVNTYDLKGAAPVAQNSYGLAHDIGNATFAYGSPRQFVVDLLTNQASGVVTAITSQPTYPLSNTAPGTASLFSGLHPDAASPPANGGRADDIAYVFFDAGLTPGSVLFFVADFGFLPVSLPLSSFLANSTGTACVSPGLQVLSLAIFSGTQAQLVITIPAAARALLPGNAFVFDGIALDAATQVLHGGTCGMQRY